jgi:hypothetical protein
MLRVNSYAPLRISAAFQELVAARVNAIDRASRVQHLTNICDGHGELTGRNRCELVEDLNNHLPPAPSSSSALSAFASSSESR